MKKYKKMSARKFLEKLPYLIKDGYKGNFYTICISERFLKKIRKEMRKGMEESLTNIYIFCCGYVLDPKEQKNFGLYLKDCDTHYEVIMCRLYNPFFSLEDLSAVATLDDLTDKEQSLKEPQKNADNNSSENLEKSDTDLLDAFVGKKLENDNNQTLFQSFAGYNMYLYFL